MRRLMTRTMDMLLNFALRVKFLRNKPTEQRERKMKWSYKVVKHLGQFQGNNK